MFDTCKVFEVLWADISVTFVKGLKGCQQTKRNMIVSFAYGAAHCQALCIEIYQTGRAVRIENAVLASEKSTAYK